MTDDAAVTALESALTRARRSAVNLSVEVESLRAELARVKAQRDRLAADVVQFFDTENIPASVRAIERAEDLAREIAAEKGGE